MAEADLDRPMEEADAARRRSGWVSLWLIVAIFLFGLAEIAVLPPWEGFDEIAHWSSIQELADRHKVEVVQTDAKMSTDLDRYWGPLPHGIDARGRSYRALHDHPPASTAGGPGHYAPGAGLNWEAQHPPLYYALMVPFYAAAHGLSWIDHLFVLRLVSWLIAMGGLALGALATRRAEADPGNGLSTWTTPLSLLWPILFAGFIADLARLGNDSLCLLIFGAVWWLLLPLLSKSDEAGGARPRSAALIGLLLGAGLWTKAFFGPISMGVGALLLWRAYRDRSLPKLGDAALAVGLGWVIGAGWYLLKLKTSGSLTGSIESIQLVHSGGLLQGLMLHHDPYQVLRGLAVIGETIGWSGTWSLARVSEHAMAVVAGFLCLLAGVYMARLRGERRLIAWAPLAVVAPVAAGLVYHNFIRIAIDGIGTGTPGWYVHIMAPALGLMMALAWRWPKLFAALSVYTLGYTAVSWWAELSLFSGCTAQDVLNHYDFTHAVCGVDGATLKRLGNPRLGAVVLIAAIGAMVVASRLAWKGRGAAAEDALEVLQPL